MRLPAPVGVAMGVATGAVLHETKMGVMVTEGKAETEEVEDGIDRREEAGAICTASIVN